MIHVHRDAIDRAGPPTDGGPPTDSPASDSSVVPQLRAWLSSCFHRCTLGRFLPTERLGRADYVLSFIILAICFVLFFHDDMWVAGWDSLNYLFGSPLEFYENCKRIHGGGQTMAGTPYPPPIYIIFALWLYPFKLLGLITGPATLPHYLTYWLKILTTLAYISSAAIFYRIALEYLGSKDWARFTAAMWLSAPLALFSQFIFSQYDIFYVLLTLTGFLMFLRGRLVLASVCFGSAITFKYFPAFVFAPLLLMYEKRVSRLAAYCLIFATPTLLINVLYGGSPAFIEGVREHIAINRIFYAVFDIGLAGFWAVYLLPTIFAILCGIAYFAEVPKENRPYVAAYFWLASSILPFVFIIWHPQWMMFVVPPIVLTSMLARSRDRWMRVDLVGMVLFVGTVSLTFVNNADMAMFQGGQLGMNIDNSYLMADVFDWFGAHSLGVFYSGFCAYLILQFILKRRALLGGTHSPADASIDYRLIRQRLYIGLMIFLLPACFALYEDLAGNVRFINNFAFGRRYGDLMGSRRFEQTFIATGKAINQVSLLLETSSRLSFEDASLEIVDAGGRSVGSARASIGDTQGAGWYKINFAPIPVSAGARYAIRLSAPTLGRAESLTWWASVGNTYNDGQAVIDGVPKDWDFAFRIGFVK